MPNRNALTREFVSGSFSGTPSSTLTRRSRSGCCARNASGHVVAAPISVMRSRRLIACPEAQTGHRAGSNWEVGSGQTEARKCPLWVKSRHRGTSSECPLYPQKQTSLNAVVTSALCLKQTFMALFDHLETRNGNQR